MIRASPTKEDRVFRVSRRHFLYSAVAGAALPGLATAQTPRVRTLLGTGIAGSQQEPASGSQSLVNNPYGIVVGPDGGIYFCEVDTGRTRRYDAGADRLTAAAGDGQKRYQGDGGAALSASFSAPHEIRFDRQGHLFVVERDAHVVRRVDATTGVVTTVAGTGMAGFSGDGGPAATAQLRMPHSIAFDAGGRLLICDIGNSRIRAVDTAAGSISTYAGTGDRGAVPDDGPLDGAALNGPRSIDTDPEGNVFLVLREGNAVFKIDARTRRLQRVAGTGTTGYSGDGGPAAAATFNGPKGIAYSAADRSLYVVDTENHVIRRVDLQSGIVTTVLGTGERGDGPDGDPRSCRLARPHGVFAAAGRLYVTDSENHRIRVLE
jgi:DNA-binding beta-propeller fold protein YncE